MESVARREVEGTTFALLDGHVDTARRVVERGGTVVRLTGREAELIEFLASRAGQTLPRERLLAEVFGYQPTARTRTLDTTIRRVRAKIEPDPGRPQLLQTVHGTGYRWIAPQGVHQEQRPTVAIGPRAHVPRDPMPLVGREQELALVESAARLRANATWQHVLEVENYEALPGSRRINYVPSVVGNVIADINPLNALDQVLWLNTTLRVVGPMAAPIRAVSQARPNLEANLANEAKGYALLDVGARLEGLIGGFSVDGRIQNLLDTQYTQGGSTLFPYPQPGRWFLITLEWAFEPVRADERQ